MLFIWDNHLVQQIEFPFWFVIQDVQYDVFNGANLFKNTKKRQNQNKNQVSKKQNGRSADTSQLGTKRIIKNNREGIRT